jgi:hypothetical protein
MATESPLAKLEQFALTHAKRPELVPASIELIRPLLSADRLRFRGSDGFELDEICGALSKATGISVTRVIGISARNPFADVKDETEEKSVALIRQVLGPSLGDVILVIYSDDVQHGQKRVGSELHTMLETYVRPRLEATVRNSLAPNNFIHLGWSTLREQEVGEYLKKGLVFSYLKTLYAFMLMVIDNKQHQVEQLVPIMRFLSLNPPFVGSAQTPDSWFIFVK